MLKILNSVLFTKSIFLNFLRSLVILYIFFPSVINCQNDRQKFPYEIDLKKNFKNIKVINLSYIGTEISYIPLETNTECLIQEISKVLFSESYIFVSVFTKLYQFEKNGKFVRQIGSQGRGPEEYSSVGDFCIDDKTKEIFIINAASYKLLIFGFDGVFKGSCNLSFRPAQIISKDQQLLMFNLWNAPGKNRPGWIITSRQGRILKVINYNLKRMNQPGFIVRDSPSYTHNNKLHFMEFGVDTLYNFELTDIKPYAVFLLDDLKMDPDPLVTPVSFKDSKLSNMFWVKSVLENNNIIFIELGRGLTDASVCAIYNKKADDVTFVIENVFKDDLGIGVGFWPKQIINDKILIDYVDAFDLLKRIIPTDLRKNLTETSNPVIMIVKSK